MSRPQPDAEPPPRAPRSALAALGWAVACALCASGVWVAGFLLADAQIAPNSDLLRLVAYAVPVIAVSGALGGLFGGSVVGLFYNARDSAPRVLGRGGAVVGFLGGLLTVPATLLLRDRLGLLASTALLWALVGFGTGWGAYWLSRQSVSSEVESPRERRRPWRFSEWLVGRLFLFLATLILAFVFLTIATARYLE